MDSTPSPAVEPNNAIAAAADERLKHAYRQIASADEQLARVTARLSEIERDDAHKAAPVSPRRPSRGGPALRGVTGLLLAGCIIGGAFLSQSPSGDATRLMITRWVSPVFASSVPLDRARPDVAPSPVQVAAADATDLPASSPAPAAAQPVAPTAAASSPDLTEQLQTITRNIANLDQKIEQLRAAQEQLAIQMDRDTARAIGELKASQEELTRLMAKPSEPNPRSKTQSVTSSVSSSAARLAVTSHQPTSAHVSPQTSSSSATRLPPPQQ
jgi:flagellar biosynthesis chaperone FliJ